MENKKKLLILGSDYGALDLVREAKRMGLYVYVADLMEKSPAKQEADEALYISTTDTEALVAFVKEHNVNGVLAGASGFNVAQTRKICKELDMPMYCRHDMAWKVASDKRAFKDLCMAEGVSVAKDYKIDECLKQEDLEVVDFPVVVKPVDLSGNRGQSYCHNIEELKEGYKKAREMSGDSRIIVEKQMTGPEFSGYYLLADGKARLLFFTADHHEKGEKANIYSIKNITCAGLEQYKKDIDCGITKVFEKAGLTDGVAFVDCMYDEDDGHFHVLEMGYRLGGPVIYIMYDRLSGFNTMRWMIETAIGVKHTEEDFPVEKTGFKRYAASYNLFTTHEGQIASIRGLDEVEGMSGVVIDMPKREGGCVRDHANMGVIRLIGEDCMDVCEKIALINERLKIEDAEGRNMYIHFTSFDVLEKEYMEGLKESGLK